MSESRPPAARIFYWIRQRVFAGILTLFPIVVTIWFGKEVLGFLDNILGKHLVQKFPGLGIVTLVLLLLVVGTVARSFIGRKAVALGDAIVHHIPLARTLYVAVKQILELVFRDEKEGFRGVALIEYPRKGLYAVTFVTTESSCGEVQERTQEKLASVFLPTTPNPTSGFLILIPEKDLIPLSMGVEDAMAFIVSFGIVVPSYQPAGGQSVRVLPAEVAEKVRAGSPESSQPE